MNIYDIAGKAQVSIATVSRVLNNSPRVSEKTRRRVNEVIRNEGYVPNAFARGLGLDTMRMVGVMCTDVTDMFFAEAVGRIEQLLLENETNIVLCCTGNSLENKKKKLEYLVNRRVDAVILIGSVFREEKDNSHIRSAAAEIPVIMINAYVSLPNVYCILCDERGAVRDTVRALSAGSFKRLLYLYDVATFSGKEKLAGFAEGCVQCGIAESDRLIVKTEKTVDGAAKTVAELCTGEIPFDGIIASEDIIAAGALKGLQKAGVSVPVTGFNNSLIAECTSPALTSVDNMSETMCRAAVQMLVDLSSGGSAPVKTVVSARICERESFRIHHCDIERI